MTKKSVNAIEELRSILSNKVSDMPYLDFTFNDVELKVKRLSMKDLSNLKNVSDDELSLSKELINYCIDFLKVKETNENLFVNVSLDDVLNASSQVEKLIYKVYSVLSDDKNNVNETLKKN